VQQLHLLATHAAGQVRLKGQGVAASLVKERLQLTQAAAIKPLLLRVCR
jgi:hypothetical protein